MGECITWDPNDSTAPTTSITPDGGQIPAAGAVVLTSSEPATIYYTTDGSEPTTSSASGVTSVAVPNLAVGDGDVTVRFFAVDPAGNSEAPKSAVFTLNVAPGAVSGLAVAIAGADATVSWTAPTDPDYAGVIVTRATGPISAPISGMTYATGESIAPGLEVVYVGTEASYQDAGITPGYARYAVWAYDVWNTYSAVRVGGAELAIPAQTASISVDVASTTATVTASPSLIGLNTGTVTYNAANTFLLLPLELQNRTSRTLFNFKVVVTSVTGGNVGNENGTIGGDPYLYVVPGAGTGATQSRILQINNVAAGATVTIDLTIANHPLLLGPSTWAQPSIQGSRAQLFDTGSKNVVNGALPQLDNMMGPRGESTFAPSYFGGSFSDNGRWFYLSGRQSSRVTAVDLTTMQPVLQSKALTVGKGHAVWPRLVADRNMLYVGVTAGVHAYVGQRFAPPNARKFTLVSLDASTLKEVSRVDLESSLTGDAGARVRAVTISPDGLVAAIAVRSSGLGYDTGELHLVDLATMTLMDTDTGTAGYQPVAIADASDLEFTPDGSKLYVAPIFQVGGDLQIVDMATYSVTRLAATVVGPQMVFGPDGKLYFGQPAGTEMWVHTVGTTTATKLPNYGAGVGAIIFDRDGQLWCQPTVDSDDILQVDPADGTVLNTMLGDGKIHGGGHWLAITPF